MCAYVLYKIHVIIIFHPRLIHKPAVIETWNGRLGRVAYDAPPSTKDLSFSYYQEMKGLIRKSRSLDLKSSNFQCIFCSTTSDLPEDFMVLYFNIYNGFCEISVSFNKSFWKMVLAWFLTLCNLRPCLNTNMSKTIKDKSLKFSLSCFIITNESKCNVGQIFKDNSQRIVYFKYGKNTNLIFERTHSNK